MGTRYLQKQIVKRVSIEGEHTLMLTVKQQHNGSFVIELTPIYNAPHQRESILIHPGEIKFALAYKYMF